jgi:hypothetical protein
MGAYIRQAAPINLVSYQTLADDYASLAVMFADGAAAVPVAARSRYWVVS